MATYLPYHEPGIVRILILSSFILLLNVVNYILDKYLYCGLVGQILLGIAWGTPGGKWIDESTEKVFLDLGYLGLILIVYEGGLLSSMGTLMKNIHLSLIIAFTGITAPIAISFSILGYSNATPVAAFAAGAALCSTSLGTAFTIMSTSKLMLSKVGVLLTSAAMIDDIAGLVMLQVISNLGDGSFTAVSVIRPVFVSIGLIVITALVCWLVVRPATRYATLNQWKFPKSAPVYFVCHTLLLFGIVTGATYAGASLLTAAYVTGAAISWWDKLEFEQEEDIEMSEANLQWTQRTLGEVTPTQNAHSTTTGYDQYSNDGSFSPSSQASTEPSTEASEDSIEVTEDVASTIHQPHITGLEVFEKFYSQPLGRILRPIFFATVGFSIPITQMFTGRLLWRGLVYSVLMAISKLICCLWLLRVKSRSKTNNYAVPLLGLSMVPRGEIGFLVASLAESKGVFGNPLSPGGSSEVYVIVVWAVVLCTMVAPICIGLLVRKIKLVDADGGSSLGVWGFT